MLRTLLLTGTLCLCLITTAFAQEGKIKSAMSAAPPSISADATILDWPAEMGGEMPVLRKGTNDWTCLPDMPDSEGNDPMCLDEPWLAWVDAWINKKEPAITKMGFGYMLQGSAPETGGHRLECDGADRGAERQVEQSMIFSNVSQGALQSRPVDQPSEDGQEKNSDSCSQGCLVRSVVFRQFRERASWKRSFPIEGYQDRHFKQEDDRPSSVMRFLFIDGRWSISHLTFSVRLSACLVTLRYGSGEHDAWGYTPRFGPIFSSGTLSEHSSMRCTRNGDLPSEPAVAILRGRPLQGKRSCWKETDHGLGRLGDVRGLPNSVLNEHFSLPR